MGQDESVAAPLKDRKGGLGTWDAHLPRTARTIFELPGADGLREQSEESDAPRRDSAALRASSSSGAEVTDGACDSSSDTSSPDWLESSSVD